jgi:hypothetical protein
VEFDKGQKEARIGLEWVIRRGNSITPDLLGKATK